MISNWIIRKVVFGGLVVLLLVAGPGVMGQEAGEAPAGAVGGVKAGEATSAAPVEKSPLGASSEEIESQPVYTIDAMVGQVNGRPVYANEIFKMIGVEQLTRLGEQRPRPEFRAELQKLITNTLRSHVTDSLIYADADRNLSKQERSGILVLLERQRQTLISEWGGGVPKLANEKMQRELGYGLEQELEYFRQRVMVSKYRRERIQPKVIVTRREIERYYEDNKDQYQKYPTVTLRLILIRDEAKVKGAVEALKGGEDFEAVAKEYSDYKASSGGLRDPDELKSPLSSYNELAWEPVNMAVRDLKEGEYAGPIETDSGTVLVKVEELDEVEQKPMKAIYKQIERELYGSKFNYESRKYLANLLRKGNFSPIDEMVNSLVEVGMSRFARLK